MGSNEHNYIHWGTIKAASFLADRWALSLLLPIAASALITAWMRGPVRREKGGATGKSRIWRCLDGGAAVQVEAGLPLCLFHLWWLAFAFFSPILPPPSPPSRSLGMIWFAAMFENCLIVLTRLTRAYVCLIHWKCAGWLRLAFSWKEPRNGTVAREQARRRIMSSSPARDQWGRTPNCSGKGETRRFRNPARKH